jgi:hypothetical protein
MKEPIKNGGNSGDLTIFGGGSIKLMMEAFHSLHKLKQQKQKRVFSVDYLEGETKTEG